MDRMGDGPEAHETQPRWGREGGTSQWEMVRGAQENRWNPGRSQGGETACGCSGGTGDAAFQGLSRDFRHEAAALWRRCCAGEPGAHGQKGCTTTITTAITISKVGTSLAIRKQRCGRVLRSCRKSRRQRPSAA